MNALTFSNVMFTFCVSKVAGCSFHLMSQSDTPDRKEFVMGQIKYRFGDVMRTMFVDNPMTVVTDQSQLYKFLTDIKDHNNRPMFQHEVCRHDLNKYASSNGVSSNRLEAAFAHIKRA